MRPSRLRLGTIAAWLGIVALSFDALVPIHLAFDLAHTFQIAAQRQDAGSTRHDFSWRMLALLTGHLDADGPAEGKSGSHGKHHRPDCAVCSSLGTLAGFAPASAAPLSVPIRIEPPVRLEAAESTPRPAPAAAYRSRAPPIATADPIT